MNKSAKDLAFDRERMKYRRQIKELTHILDQKKWELSEANNKIEMLQDWNERLLTLTEMSEEDLKNLIKRTKETDEFMNLMSRFFNLKGEKNELSI